MLQGGPVHTNSSARCVINELMITKFRCRFHRYQWQSCGARQESPPPPPPPPTPPPPQGARCRQQAGGEVTPIRRHGAMDSTEAINEEILKPPWGEIGRAITLGVVSGVCKLILKVLNSTTVHGEEQLVDSALHRPEGVGLITICNHTSMYTATAGASAYNCSVAYPINELPGAAAGALTVALGAAPPAGTMDDPSLFSAIFPWRWFLTEPSHHEVRWSLCAKEVCFKNELLRQFFLNGKVLPIERGGGIDQPVMKVAGEPRARAGRPGPLPGAEGGVSRAVASNSAFGFVSASGWSHPIQLIALMPNPVLRYRCLYSPPLPTPLSTCNYCHCPLRRRGRRCRMNARRCAANQVAAGKWVHVFPEGRVVYSGTLGAFRSGVGKLVCDARAANGGHDPIVLPFHHSGMGEVLPQGGRVPRVGKKVRTHGQAGGR